MKRSTLMLTLAVLISAMFGYTIAPGESTPSIPICFNYHDNKSVETFAVPVETICPAGYTYGRGTVANTGELIAILESVATKNFNNGVSASK